MIEKKRIDKMHALDAPYISKTCPLLTQHQEVVPWLMARSSPREMPHRILPPEQRFRSFRAFRAWPLRSNDSVGKTGVAILHEVFAQVPALHTHLFPLE